MFDFVVNHPVISLVVYLAVSFVMLAYFHACSKASGNDDDPYRDEGNGGASTEDSIAQYNREQQAKANRRLIESMSKVV